MLLPDKHITIAQSLIGLGGFALEQLKVPKTIDSLWHEFQEVNNTKEFPAYHTFENLVLAIDFLFIVGIIKDDGDGRLTRCD